MKRIYVVILMLAFFDLNAQVAPDKYWVQFTDKNGTPYNIDNPKEFLSDRAIQRRYDYDIAFDEYDLPVNPSYVEAVENTGAVILHPSKWLNGVTIETYDKSVLMAIEKLPFVEKTRILEDEPLKQMLKEKSFDNEQLFDIDDTNLHRDYYGYAYNHINQLNGIGLHDMGYRGEGMIIGVCDGGFICADSHEAFASAFEEGRVLSVRDYLYKGGNVFSESAHGTSCWGLMAGDVPDKYVGTAPDASYVLCRTEDVNRENVIEEYNWVSAAEFLDSLGVDVISTSLAYIFFDDAEMDHDYQDLDGKTAVITIGAEIAASRGILCINAAGNDGANAFPYIGAPADGENVLTVGAVGSDGNRAYFSSIGPTYDGRIKPDVMAFGHGATIAVGWDNYNDGSGTSFACPVLAGMATCLWQANKHHPASAIRDVLRQNANNSSNPNNEYGYGIPDFMQALESLYVEEKTDVAVKPLISVYPNPSNGNVNIDIDVEGDLNMKVYDVMGKMLYDNVINKYNKTMMSEMLMSLNEGLYIINVVGEERNQIVKFIKY